jgi:hypothetical protein
MSDRVSPFGDLKDFEPAPSKKPASKSIEKAAIDQVAADGATSASLHHWPKPADQCQSHGRNDRAVLSACGRNARPSR